MPKNIPVTTSSLIPAPILVIKPSLLRCVFSLAFIPPLLLGVWLLILLALPHAGARHLPPFALVLFPLFIFSLIGWLQQISFTCFISSQQIWIERGIFWKNTQFYELYRIRDYVLHRSLIDRLMGTMQLHLFTVDTQPFDQVTLQHITYTVLVMEIRERVQRCKQANNMVLIENNATS
jgi:hypothetical protein